jgi:hypothetical protein
MSKFNSQKQVGAFLAATLIASGLLGITTAAVVTLNPAQAQAGWIDRIQLTGAYLRVGSREYFLGDYNGTGRPEYQGVTWELRNGSVIAKGYGRTPGAALWLIKKFFGPITVYSN